MFFKAVLIWNISCVSLQTDAVEKSTTKETAVMQKKLYGFESGSAYISVRYDAGNDEAEGGANPQLSRNCDGNERRDCHGCNKNRLSRSKGLSRLSR